jgi:hypothetical protein
MIDICAELHAAIDPLPHHRFPFDAGSIPKNGLYILFEDGEQAHGTDRIVRVGTHTGKDQLPSRLMQHFVKENKDRSIFRKNIGRALLNKAEDPFLAQWEFDLTTSAAKKEFGLLIDKGKQSQVESQVTQTIQSCFRFVVIPIEDKADRLFLEARLISTVSRCQGCKPSPGWLGYCSPKEKIREGGLWLVNELYKTPFSEMEFETFREVYLGA